MKRWTFLTIFIIMALVLGACVRSASTPPTNVVTPPAQSGENGQEAGEPTATNPVLDQLAGFVTQTAAALGGPGGQAPGGEGEGTAAPTAEGGVAQPTAEGGVPQATAEGGVPQATAEGGVPQATPEPGAAQPTATPVPAGAAPQSTVIVVPTSTPGIPKTYTIQSGEFPYCIARRFDLNPAELMNLNGLSGSYVRPGTVLQIPQTGHPFPGQRALQPHPTTYIVQPGDNIYSIACAFGDVGPDAIAYANGLTKPFGLTPGQELYIP
jgi:LysM repeat protein